MIKSNTRFWTKKKVIRDNWWLDRDYKEKINLLYHDYVFSSFLEDYVFIFFCFFFSYFFFFLYLPIFLIIIFLFAIFRQREYYFWINKRNPSFFTTIRPLVFLSKQGHPLALHLRKIKKENSFLFFFFFFLGEFLFCSWKITFFFLSLFLVNWSCWKRFPLYLCKHFSLRNLKPSDFGKKEKKYPTLVVFSPTISATSYLSRNTILKQFLLSSSLVILCLSLFFQSQSQSSMSNLGYTLCFLLEQGSYYVYQLFLD